jgi:hypothetical protein
MPSLSVAPAVVPLASPVASAGWPLLAGGMLLVVLGLVGLRSSMVVRRSGDRSATARRLDNHPATERGAASR